MKKLLTILLIASVAAVSLPAHAYLCWGESDNALTKLNDSEIVFSGTIKSIKKIGSSRDELGSMRYNMMFEVDKVWKGLPEIAKIVYVDTESIYEYDFQRGQEYLIYAFNLYDRRISIVGCPRAIEITDAKKDLKELGKSLYEKAETVIEKHDDFGADSVESDDLEVIEVERNEGGASGGAVENGGVEGDSDDVPVAAEKSHEDAAGSDVSEGDITAEKTENKGDELGASLDDILDGFDDVTEDGKGSYYPPEKSAPAEEVKSDVIAPIAAEVNLAPKVVPEQAEPKQEIEDQDLMDDLFGEGIDFDVSDEPAPVKKIVTETPKTPESAKTTKNKNSSVNSENNAVKQENKEVLKGINSAPKSVEQAPKQKDSDKNTPPDFVVE